MLKFSANLSMLFLEVDFLQRFKAAAEGGFTAVEFMFPYDYPAGTLKALLAENHLQHTLHNLPAGNWAEGERGIACLAGREAEFREGVAQAIAYAKALGNRKINCLTGKIPAGSDAASVTPLVVENLRYAAQALAKEGLMLLIEPINHFDIPGFYLTGTQQALDLIDLVGSDNMFIQYDIYHMQRMEGELANTMTRHAEKIGHLQVADNPHRNEPGTGEINYDFIFNLIKQSDYDGWVGCEYKPRARTEDGLGWLNAYR